MSTDPTQQTRADLDVSKIMAMGLGALVGGLIAMVTMGVVLWVAKVIFFIACVIGGSILAVMSLNAWVDDE